jgi:hypothetical protein
MFNLLCLLRAILLLLRDLRLISILILRLMLRLQAMLFYLRAFLLRLRLRLISILILRLMLRLQATLFYLRAFLLRLRLRLILIPILRLLHQLHGRRRILRLAHNLLIRRIHPHRDILLVVYNNIHNRYHPLKDILLNHILLVFRNIRNRIFRDTQIHLSRRIHPRRDILLVVYIVHNRYHLLKDNLLNHILLMFRLMLLRASLFNLTHLVLGNKTISRTKHKIFNHILLLRVRLRVGVNNLSPTLLEVRLTKVILLLQDTPRAILLLARQSPNPIPLL